MEVGRGHLGDGRAGVCPACLLITSCYPSGRETPQAALTLSAPQLYPQGASGQHPPRQAAGSVHLACGPLQGRLIPWHKLESPPLPTHTLCCRLGQAAWPLQVGFLLCPAGRTTELDTLRCDDSEHQVCVTCRAGDRAWCSLMGLMVPPGPLRPTWVLSPARSTFPLCPRRCSESEFEGSHCRHPSARPATLLCFLWVLHLFAGSHQASALQGLGAQ